MTMLLTHDVVFLVTPVPKKKNWFQIAGVPKNLGYGGCIGDWLGDLEHDSNPKGPNVQSKILDGAKLVGIHDAEGGEVTDLDPRFNQGTRYSLEDDPSFVIVKMGSGEYLAAMLVNTPEALLMQYMMQAVYPNDTNWDPRGSWVALMPSRVEGRIGLRTTVVPGNVAYYDKLQKEAEAQRAASMKIAKAREAEQAAARKKEKAAKDSKAAFKKKPISAARVAEIESLPPPKMARRATSAVVGKKPARKLAKK